MGGGGVAKAVGGGYCRLQILLKPALAVRETVAGHRLGALERDVVSVLLRQGKALPPSRSQSPLPSSLGFHPPSAVCISSQPNRCRRGVSERVALWERMEAV